MADIAYEAQVSKEFSAAMLTRMTEAKGGLLTDLGELREITGAETTTFNRADDGTTSSTAPNMYASGNHNTGGTYDAIELGPTFEYAFEKIPDVKFRKSQINYKGYIPQKLIRQLDKAEDVKVIQILDSATTNIVQTKGSVLLVDKVLVGLTDAANISTLIGIAKGAKVEAEDTPDKRAFVKMVMNKETYKVLYASEKLINSDYVGDSKKNDGSTKNEFYGCEVVIMKKPPVELPNGVIYFIPSGVLGYARWKAADTSDSSFDLKNEDSWTFIAKKSFGAALIEAESVTKFVATAF